LAILVDGDHWEIVLENGNLGERNRNKVTDFALSVIQTCQHQVGNRLGFRESLAHGPQWHARW
jgi:hypothetical protein